MLLKTFLWQAATLFPILVLVHAVMVSSPFLVFLGIAWLVWLQFGLLSELAAKLLARGAALRLAALAGALQWAGQLGAAQGDGEARALCDEALTLHWLMDHTAEVAAVTSQLASMAMNQRDLKRAQGLHAMSLLIWLKRGNQPGIAAALQGLGRVALRQDRAAAARALLEEGLEIRRAVGDRDGIAEALHGLGCVALAQQDTEAALSLFVESLMVRRELGDKGGAASCLDGLAAVMEAEGQQERAALLFGTAEAVREEIGASLSLGHRYSPEGCDYDDRMALLLKQVRKRMPRRAHQSG
jgi:tetratricopeptide (TPR) repeat protein